MLGDTLTFTVGGSGGTARTLTKINQDTYASEYLYRSTTEEIRLRVRHTKESAKNGETPFERHNVEVTNTVFATSTATEIVRQYYFVFRLKAGDVVDTAVDYVEGTNYLFGAANLVKLAGWES